MTGPPANVTADLAAENARLQAELRASRDHQDASAEILRAIASTPGSADRSLQQIAETSARLFGASSVSLRIAENGEWIRVFRVGTSAEQVRAAVPEAIIQIGGQNLPGTVVAENRQIHIADLDHIDPAMVDWPGLPPARAAGARTMAGTPLRREGKAIGAFIVYRDRLAPFTEEELLLQQSFADQAVIAIENARLFNEAQEALERQTATANILRVIASSPSDVQPVFQAIVGSAAKLFEPCSVTITTLKDDELHWNATAASISGFDVDRVRTVYPIPFDPDRSPSTRAILERRIIEIPDVTAPDTPEFTRKAASAGGFQSITFVPLVHQDKGIGTIIFTHPKAGFRYSERQLALVQTFADQAVMAIRNARLFNETQEALERQTATAEILKVIASSPSDVQPVFDVIVDRAVQLCGARMGRVYRYDGNLIHLVGGRGLSEPGRDSAQRPFPRPAAADTMVGRVMLSRKPGILADLNADETVPPLSRQMIQAIGARSQVTMPMLLAGEPIGAITLSWAEPCGYNDQKIALLQTFADQAVIAVENVRLFNETREALERQTATADILKVIASSPTNVQPVFDAIAASANRLIGGFSATVILFVGDVLQLVAFTPTNPAADEMLQASFPRPLAEFPPFGLVRNGESVQFPDTESEGVPPVNQALARSRGYRGMLFTPLMSKGTAIGILSVTRKEPGAFAAHHVQLLQTFADQAVIAIENVRLFDEVQAKTRDLSEALTYQTGSGNILKVIASSPTDVGPVLKAIVESACELCEADDALAALKEDDDLLCRAHHGSIPVVWERQPIDGLAMAGRAVLARTPVHVHDLIGPEGEIFPRSREFAHQTNVRTVLCVPLLGEGESIGVIVLRRTEVRPFTEKQIALLQTFADQAVIAIGNVRLFDEVQAKTRDLSEALQQQTATAEVLKVISRSAFDLQAVFQTLVESAAQLCRADKAAILRLKDDRFQLVATHGFPAEFRELMLARGLDVDRGSVTGRAALECRAVQVADILADPEFTVTESQRRGGFRTVLGVPLLREGKPIGALFLTRGVVELFTQQQIDLVTTFADQAVIAIENARLFDEVQARTRELAASLEDLRTAQDRLVQTEKLASLGQLTAGIAHEIKNPLNFVNNFAALSAELTDELNDLLKPLAFADQAREEIDELTGLLKDNLEKVVQHGKRADSIVKNMLLHSREGSGEHRPADINALLDESLNLAYHGARAEKPQFNVTLQRDFDATAGTIEVFPQEITRVFLNLISNGFYAVTKRRAENGGSEFEPVVSATTRSLGDTVEIRIRDNGTGIPSEVRDKMFNPFFTTKPAGEGTGLGLSMSHDIIVKQHGGSIDVETEPGQFTEFRIVLPRTSLSNSNRGQT